MHQLVLLEPCEAAFSGRTSPGAEDVMDQVGVITGRQYKLFEYYGDPQARPADSSTSVSEPWSRRPKGWVILGLSSGVYGLLGTKARGCF